MRCITALQSSPPAGGESIEIIFSGGVYVGENTTQSVSVRIVRLRRTIRARSGLKFPYQKSPFGFSDRLTPQHRSAAAFCALSF